MPPAVGYAATSSDIENATNRISPQMIGQPHEMATGPPLFHACGKLVKQPARTEMIVNEIAKLENPLHARLVCCLWPSRARRFSSSVCSGTAVPAGTAVPLTCKSPRVVSQPFPGGESTDA